MTPETFSFTREWLVKAAHDRRAAKTPAEEPDVLLDSASFHCQQAAEKAIKGFLLFHGQRFGKTHNIRQLLETARAIDPAFAPWLAVADRLTELGVEFRYPADVSQPSPEEFATLFSQSESLCNFVLDRLPPECHP